MLQFLKIIILLLTIYIPQVLGSLHINDCSFGGGMGAPVTTCDCAGYEWLLYDRTPSDGPRKTVCIGIIRATECYQYIGGPPQECNFSSKVTLRTDKQMYTVGENITLEAANRLSSPIRYYGSCSLHLCQYQGGEWFCEIEDCYAEMVVINPGSSIEFNEWAPELAGTRLKYRFEYQTFLDDTLYTIESNEFTIQSE